MFYGIDPLYYIMLAPVIIFSFWAQFKVKSNFEKFSEVTVKSGKTGGDVARMILKRNGINTVQVEETSGFLSDHYSPAQKVLRLSDKVYNSSSISSLGVAAHEAGHALQHHEGAFIMRVWIAFARPMPIISNAATWLIIIGFLMSMFTLAKIGFWFFLIAVIFQIITLPLEFDASNRAKKLLFEYGMVTEDEQKGVKTVLDSAAMTYVAAALASLTQLLYFAIRLGLFGGRRD
jgi:uncharacterized protein